MVLTLEEEWFDSIDSGQNSTTNVIVPRPGPDCLGILYDCLDHNNAFVILPVLASGVLAQRQAYHSTSVCVLML